MSHQPNENCKDAGFTCDFKTDGENQCPCVQLGDHAEWIYNQMVSSFDEWFTAILLAQETCLQRDVLRDTKPELWAAWQERNP